MTIATHPTAPAEELDPVDELRAQYVACSYLATACQEALGRFPAPAFEQDGARVAQRALEFMLAIEWDWRQTLQELAHRVARATSCDRDSVAEAFQPRPARSENLAYEGQRDGSADTAAGEPVTYTYAEDAGTARQSTANHRPDYRRRPSVRRRV